MSKYMYMFMVFDPACIVAYMPVLSGLGGCRFNDAGFYLQSGVPRAGYRGVVSFMRNGRRIYFAPPPTWNGYDRTWN